MKVFISQPMRGKTEIEISQERERLIQTAKAEVMRRYVISEKDMPIEIINSFFDDFTTDQNVKCVPLKYLAKSLGLLADADVAFFGPGWEEARGCRIEHKCCVEYGIDTIEQYRPEDVTIKGGKYNLEEAKYWIHAEVDDD